MSDVQTDLQVTGSQRQVGWSANGIYGGNKEFVESVELSLSKVHKGPGTMKLISRLIDMWTNRETNETIEKSQKNLHEIRNNIARAKACLDGEENWLRSESEGTCRDGNT